MSVARAAGLLKAVPDTHVDTNVYFSAFSSTRGVPFELWRRALRREFKVLTSPAILRELAEVLRTDLKWPERDIVAQLKLLAKVAELVQPTTAVSAVADDPDDDRILECAIAGNADLIVTYDRHLTKLKTFRGVGIVRPVDFLRTLGESVLKAPEDRSKS